MAVRLYVNASDDTIRQIAGISEETAVAVRGLEATYEAADPTGRDHEASFAAYEVYVAAMREFGEGADLYAALTRGDGFNRFQGRRLVRDENGGRETDALAVAQLLEAQERWADGCGDDAYADAFVAALKRAQQAALRGNLTVYWG